MNNKSRLYRMIAIKCFESFAPNSFFLTKYSIKCNLIFTLKFNKLNKLALVAFGTGSLCCVVLCNFHSF